jgi:hypothetical protein
MRTLKRKLHKNKQGNAKQCTDHVEVPTQQDSVMVEDERDAGTEPENTPREADKLFLSEAGVSPTKHPEIVKEITAFRTLSKHLSDAPSKVRNEILKRRTTLNKSRCASYLSSRLNVNRRSVFSPRKTSAAYGRRLATKKLMVTNFLKKNRKQYAVAREA